MKTKDKLRLVLALKSLKHCLGLTIGKADCLALLTLQFDLTPLPPVFLPFLPLDIYIIFTYPLVTSSQKVSP